jgi:hypothetical protein
VLSPPRSLGNTVTPYKALATAERDKGHPDFPVRAAPFPCDSSQVSVVLRQSLDVDEEPETSCLLNAH